MRSSTYGLQSAIGAGETLGASGLQRLAQQLRERGDEGRLFGETEFLDLWYGERGWDEEHYGELIRLLDQSEDFRRPKARPHRYRLLRLEEEKGVGGSGRLRHAAGCFVAR